MRSTCWNNERSKNSVITIRRPVFFSMMKCQYQTHDFSSHSASTDSPFMTYEHQQLWSLDARPY